MAAGSQGDAGHVVDLSKEDPWTIHGTCQPVDGRNPLRHHRSETLEWQLPCFPMVSKWCRISSIQYGADGGKASCASCLDACNIPWDRVCRWIQQGPTRHFYVVFIGVSSVDPSDVICLLASTLNSLGFLEFAWVCTRNRKALPGSGSEEPDSRPIQPPPQP